MGDLKISEIPLEKCTLVRVNVKDENHIKMVENFRDPVAMEMCYDVKLDVEPSGPWDQKNIFLAKNDEDGYFGYMRISEDIGGDRVLCYIVQEKLRGKGLGKIMLGNVSDYLLDSNLASRLKLYIDKSNYISSNLAMQCGFEKGHYVGADMVDYYKSK